MLRIASLKSAHGHAPKLNTQRSRTRDSWRQATRSRPVAREQLARTRLAAAECGFAPFVLCVRRIVCGIHPHSGFLIPETISDITCNQVHSRECSKSCRPVGDHLATFCNSWMN